MLLRYSLVFVCLTFGTAFGSKSYEGFHLVKIAEGIPDVQEKLPEGEDVKYFSARTVLVSNEVYQNLEKKGIKAEILNENIQDDLNKEQETEKAQTRNLHYGNRFVFKDTDMIFQSFPRYNEINSFLNSLAATNPSLATVESIGRSYEGREMKMIKIGGGRNKPIIWIDAGIHAREWAAPISALYIANELVSNYNKDSLTKKLVDNFEWQILPTANPDGYEYSHTRDRMWRKTRSNPQSRCPGADPNRNWGYHWNEVGASSNPCSDTYAGTNAFSEVETRNMRDHILKEKARMKAYLSIHAYSQLWLTPWGFTSDVPNNYNDLVAKAKIAASAINSKSGKRFTVGSSTNVLYAAAGGSDDWALGVAGVPYAYTLELRPDENSSSGFVLPAREIIPCGDETWAGVKAFAQAILQ